MKRFIKMDEHDLVATALVDLKSRERADIFSTDNICLDSVIALEDIPYGNKIALADILKGDNVIKYGTVIGKCTCDIRKGALVHVHNGKSLVVDIPPAFKKEIMRQMNIKVEEDMKNDI